LAKGGTEVVLVVNGFSDGNVDAAADGGLGGS
jgi:hypothetical protein